MRPDAPVQGDLIAGKYRVRSVLGRGRGTLVLADHTAFEQRVAIRIVTPSMSEPVEIAKFRREAKVLAKLGSEHVARILDVGLLIDGSSYLVRQYLEGVDLTSYIRERRMLPVDEAIGLILQATEAVAESHAYGVLVRELSPEHLFLAERSPGVRGGPRILKITDFGTAKLMREAKTNGPEDYTATTVLGLSPYASPEMLRRQRDVDGRTDIWSLAAILYEMLTGSAPFGKDPISLAITISRDDPPPFDRFRRDVPREVEAAIRQALAKDKNARPADTHAFAASLVRFAPDDARHLMARIRDLAGSARARTGDADDDEEEISLDESGEMDDPPTDEVEVEELQTQVGRPQDIVRGLPPPPQAESHRAGARRPLQEKTEALGVTFVPSDPYRQNNHAFAGAAAGLEPASPVRPSTPAPAPNVGRSPSQPGFPRIVPPAVASQMGARGSSPPPAHAAQGMTGHPEPTQLGFGHVVPVEPFAQPSYPPPAGQHGAYPPVAGSAWMTSPGLAVPHMQPGAVSNGRKIAMFAIGGALAALLILVVVVLALPAPPATKPSASSESAAAEAPPDRAATAAATTAAAPAQPPPPIETVAAPESAAPSATSTSTAQSTAKAAAKPSNSPTSGATATASAAPKGDTGTLVVVVVGGTCTITVNGAFKGTTNSLKLSVAPGSYAVSCKPSTGPAKSNIVLVKADHSAMAMFNLN